MITPTGSSISEAMLVPMIPKASPLSFASSEKLPSISNIQAIKSTFSHIIIWLSTIYILLIKIKKPNKLHYFFYNYMIIKHLAIFLALFIRALGILETRKCIGIGLEV
jgi:hypothetical protein